MKKFITAIAIFGAATMGWSQGCVEQTEADYNGDEASCRTAVSLYSEFLKQKNYNDASREWWNTVKVCPKYKTNLYANGTYIYKQMATAVTDKKSEDFKNKMDSLEIVYNMWVENYGNCPKIDLERAHANMQDENKRYNKAYKHFKAAVDAMPENEVRSYDAVYYFRSAYFMMSGKLIDCEEMMNLYEKLDKIAVTQIEQFKGEGKTQEVQDWLNAQATMESYIAPCANCDQLLKIYKPQVADDPTNLELLKKVTAKLSKLECKDPLMLEMAIEIDKQEPSYESKMALGSALWAKEDYSKAKEYFEQALAYEECTAEVKTSIYLKFGNRDYKKGSYKSAFKYGKLAGGCEGKYLQAKAVAGTGSDKSCATSKTARTAIYSYALDLAESAGSCVSQKWMDGIKGQLSSKGDLFTGGLKPGDSYEVPCWGVKVKLRAQ